MNFIYVNDIFYILCLIFSQTEKDLLWQRIQQRLEIEPFRKQYNEDSRAWMEDTVDFYESMRWDFTLPNNESTILDLMHTLLQTLRSSVLKFEDYYAASNVARSTTSSQRLFDSENTSHAESSSSSSSLLTCI